MADCDWGVTNAGEYPNDLTFVSLLYAKCGVEFTQSPDPWMDIDALLADPPACRRDTEETP